MRFTTFFILLLVSCLLLCLFAPSVEARGRGGGGGGGRGSRGGSRSRGTSRGSRSSSRARSSFGAKWWVVGAASGYLAARTRIYGINYYYTRHSYRYSSEPKVCYNHRNGCLYESNSTWRSGCMKDFICPGRYDPDSYTYCCGDEDGSGQYCCNYWGSPGRTAGAVIGILLAVAAMIIVLYCVYRHCCKSQPKRRSPPTPQVQYAAVPIVTPQPDNKPPQPDNKPPPSYGDVQAGAPPPPGFAPPPADINSGATPYPLKPQDPSAPNPQAGPYPPPVAPMGDTPYPQAPYPPAEGNTPYPLAESYPPAPYQPSAPYPPTASYPPQAPGSGTDYPLKPPS